MDGKTLLSLITYLSRYSRPDKGVLSYRDSVRYLTMNVFGHKAKVCGRYLDEQELDELIGRLCVFPSMRGIQFLDGVLNRNERLYNCAGILIRSVKDIWLTYYLLLCGCGVGFNIMRQNVCRLPRLLPKHERQSRGVITHVVEDSVLGWAKAAQALLESFFCGFELSGWRVEFDYSRITPKGEILRSCGRPAPGPEPLKQSLEMLRRYLEARNGTELKPIDVYDIICMLAQSVVSGGVRRSALISLFSPDDDDMVQSKVGDWYKTHPWRSYCNNSMVLTPEDYRDEDRVRRLYRNVLATASEYGEPGVINLPSFEHAVNPCAEIVFHPVIDGEHSYQFCNLTEVCVSNCRSLDEVKRAVRVATVFGTIQASFTDLVCPVAKALCERDALLGVSLTGSYDFVNKHWDFLEDLRNEVYDVNHVVSRWLGIRPAARATCIKPSGTVSCLAMCSSGIHPWYAKSYIRNINMAETDLAYRVYRAITGLDGVPNSLIPGNFVCGFPVCARGQSSWDTVHAAEMLRTVMLAHRHWVRLPNETSSLSNAVSCTILFTPDEIDDIVDISVSANRESLANSHGFVFVGNSYLPRISKYYGLTMPFVVNDGKNPEVLEYYGKLVKAIESVDDEQVNDLIRLCLERGYSGLSDLNGGCDGDYCLVRPIG